ncbi:hypothetical protein [Rhizobium lusitanum]|uniref:hypothetical protein n=1 Tax=Rhizobium lusitanum TaxID=293958 RepID=UPI001AEFEB56|nr:hypothetical protein [Rhizobium lusitanum]
MNIAHTVARNIALKKARLGFLVDRRRAPAPMAASSRQYEAPVIQLKGKHGRTETEDCKYRGRTSQRGDIPLFWNEPTEGHATRRPALRQAKTARGFTIFNGTVVFHESELEHRVSTIMQGRADVRELHSQFPVLSFSDDDGVIHDHTFDYYVVFNDGFRVAIAVKHARKQAQILEMFNRIARQDFSHVADDLRLMTEEDATYEAFYNAHDILRAREHFDTIEYETTLSIAKRLAGRFRFGELLRGCRHVGSRRDAVWQLIDRGHLVPLSRGRISDLSWLTVPS